MDPRTRFDPTTLIGPRSAWQYVGFIVLSLALGRLSNRFPDWTDYFFAAFVVSIIGLMWLIDRRRKQLTHLKWVPKKEPPRPAKGLILLVSPFHARHPEVEDPETAHVMISSLLERSVDTLTSLDFEAVHLFSSNLQPLVEAIAFHMTSGALQEVWLITTETEFIEADGKKRCVRGSDDAGALLERYLRFKYGPRPLVRRDGFVIKSWDYGSVWKKAEEIFSTSGYKANALLADVTGGTKMMSVALAMACVDPGRRMQYMDSVRDWQGQPIPKGTTTPVVIDIDPILYGAHH